MFPVIGSVTDSYTGKVFGLWVDYRMLSRKLKRVWKVHVCYLCYYVFSNWILHSISVLFFSVVMDCPREMFLCQPRGSCPLPLGTCPVSTCRDFVFTTVLVRMVSAIYHTAQAWLLRNTLSLKGQTVFLLESFATTLCNSVTAHTREHETWLVSYDVFPH